VPGPRGGSPAEARVEGRRLLGSLILPTGSRRIAPRRVPQRAQSIGSSNLVDVSRFFRVPLPMADVASYLRTHPPAGMRFRGDGTDSSPRSSVQFVFFMLTAPPAGIESDSQLLASLAPGPHGGTVVRADSELVWYPPRSVAENLRPSRYRAVTVKATFPGSHPRTIARTFLSPAVIARLTAVADSLHTLPSETIYGCPPLAYEFTVEFAARPPWPAALISADFCQGDLVTVAGTPQPALQDFESMKVFAVIAPLLGVHRKFWWAAAGSR
jgi:hypothetical protein